VYKNWCGLLAASIIRDWGVSFSKRDERTNYPIFYQTYQACISMGVIFPSLTENSNMPRFSEKFVHGHHKEESKPKTGGDQLRSSLRNANKIGIPPQIQTEINATSNTVGLLEDLLKTTPKDKIASNDLVTQVVQELKNHFDKIATLVPVQIDNEKALSALLEIHDKISSTLKKVDDIKKGINPSDKADDSDSEDSNSEPLPLKPVKEIDERAFHQNFVAPVIQQYGDPFNSFWVSQQQQPPQVHNSIGQPSPFSLNQQQQPSSLGQQQQSTSPFYLPSTATSPFGNTSPNPFVTPPSSNTHYNYQPFSLNQQQQPSPFGQQTAFSLNQQPQQPFAIPSQTPVNPFADAPNPTSINPFANPATQPQSLHNPFL